MIILSARNFYLVSMNMYGHKNLELKGPGGTMWVKPMPLGLDLKETLDHLTDVGSPKDTLVALPEGALLNFLSQQKNPSYFNLFIPPELNVPGVEKKVIEEFHEKAIDRILVIHRNVWEYGCQGLGIDYGLALMRFIQENYEVEASFGPPPYGSRPGGSLVYRRKK